MSGVQNYDRVLVLGGARSGKSRYAQSLADACGLEPVFVATAEPFDGEMAARIARHAAARDERWHLVEAPLALPDAVRTQARPDRILLIDCATLWLSNLMLHGADVDRGVQALLAALEAAHGPVILVSNEVGSSIVPDTRLGRDFRDAQGLLNQALGAACGAVVLIVAGQPLQLKPAVSAPLALRPAGAQADPADSSGR
jgi:adenosylcobinamide kinase/adenosylcobinamide-phosphate guanylyltransferase